MKCLALRRHDLACLLLATRRFLAVEALPQQLQLWSGHQWISPPVSFVEGQDPPTAISWLRRRGPSVSQATIFRLFREHKVRFYDGEKVRRVKVSRELKSGDRVLLPLQSIQDTTSLSETSSKKDGRRGLKSDEELSRLAEASRTWLLYSCNDFFVINKPEGIAAQGGKGIWISIDRIYERVAVEKNWKEKPKLVHRLDRMTTGALIVARSSDAASWLCQAFQHHSHKEQASQKGQFLVRKVYWAVVDARRMTRTRGDVRSHIQLGEAQVASQTHFELVSRKGGLAVIKLRPKTGRKHQLRVHCAHQLQAPVLGDRVYSRPRQHRTEEDFKAVRREIGEEALAHMYLHAHELTIKRPGKQPLRVTAPFPDHMTKMIQWIQRS